MFCRKKTHVACESMPSSKLCCELRSLAFHHAEQCVSSFDAEGLFAFFAFRAICSAFRLLVYFGWGYEFLKTFYPSDARVAEEVRQSVHGWPEEAEDWGRVARGAAAAWAKESRGRASSERKTSPCPRPQKTAVATWMLSPWRLRPVAPVCGQQNRAKDPRTQQAS